MIQWLQQTLRHNLKCSFCDIIEKKNEGKRILDIISTIPNPVLSCFDQLKNEIRLDEILMIQ